MERSSTSLWRGRGRRGKGTHDAYMAHPHTQPLPPARWGVLLSTVTPGERIMLCFPFINRL